MKKTLLTLLVAASAGLGARGAIDFTPIPKERVLEGIKFAGLQFHQNGRLVTYEQPRGWNYSGGGASIKFTPPSMSQAQAEIDQTALAEPQIYDEPTIKSLKEKALTSIPPNSQKIDVVSEALNPFLINTHHTYEVIFSYEAFGQEFMTGVIYVNLPDTRLRFRTTAPKADFEKVHSAFRGSMFSLEWR